MSSVVAIALIICITVAIMFTIKYMIDTKVLKHKANVECMKDLYTKEYKKREEYEKRYYELFED